MGPLILIPAAAALAGGAYWYYSKDEAPAPTAPAKKKRKPFAKLKAKVKEATAKKASDAADKAEGLTLAGLDETQAAGKAFADEMKKMGKVVGDPICTGDFCSVEIEGAGDPASEAWFENEGQHIARKAAEGAGVEATLIVAGASTYVIFSDNAKALAAQAAAEETHAAPLTMAIPTEPQAAATKLEGTEFEDVGMVRMGRITDHGYIPNRPTFGELPPGWGR